MFKKALLIAAVLAAAMVAWTCQGNFKTSSECVPQCQDKECGDDGCGGICATCGPGKACNDNFKCVSSFCGNGRLDGNETCDYAISEGDGACPTECVDDGDACTVQQFDGVPQDCDAQCTVFTKIKCEDDDGCCPSGCSPINDTDCNANCGNGVVDEGETCDPPEVACVAADDCDDGDACTNDRFAGTPDNCSARCESSPIEACQNDDGCCPEDCGPEDDNDCVGMCGDGELNGEETCDNAIAAGMEGACPADEAACDDADACTTDALVGDAADCSAACTNDAVTACTGGDGCCPETCTPVMDEDCQELCQTYCDLAMQNCQDADALYADAASCMTACAAFAFAVGTEQDTGDDTLHCRINHLNLAQNDPATHCPHGAEDGGGVCM